MQDLINQLLTARTAVETAQTDVLVELCGVDDVIGMELYGAIGSINQTIGELLVHANDKGLVTFGPKPDPGAGSGTPADGTSCRVTTPGGKTIVLGKAASTPLPVPGRHEIDLRDDEVKVAMFAIDNLLGNMDEAGKVPQADIIELSEDEITALRRARRKIRAAQGGVA